MVKRTDGVPPPPFPPAPPNPFRGAAPTSTPKCMVCTTPTRCGAPALHTKGPRCIGRPDGKDDCDCLNACGDDPWIESGRSMPCDHRRETQARIAALTQAAPTTPSPTAGMNIAQRILHVGGRNNAAGYVEFGSIQAVEALVRQVLRDLPTTQPAPRQEAQEPVMIYHGDCIIDCGEHGHHHVELLRMIPAGSKLYTAPQPSSAAQEGQ